jgi:ferredoxin--NADP+ reductase
MAYVITPGCCSDASCVSVCPVNCIHPTPHEPEFGTTATLFVDPRTCIDCGACVDACPVDAIGPADLLRGPDAIFAERNRDYYRDRPVTGHPEPHFPATLPHGLGKLDVAVVGSGPAANYTADLLLRSVGAEVTMFDRLDVAGGLLRFGVAPDHPATRRLGERFAGFLDNPNLHLMLGVGVGTDVSVTDLAAHFDAVVYAIGASTSRDLDIPGEQLAGSISATRFVAWYNGHPEVGEQPLGLDGERAVIIGNGNVALDVARILLADRDRLATTDIAAAALAALRSSRVREVVIAARRGPEHASYTLGELHDLKHLPGVELVVADRPGLADELRAAPSDSSSALLADVPLVPVDWAQPPPDGRRIVLQFDTVPHTIEGTDVVTGVSFTPGPHIPTGLVIRAIGYRGEPLDGLPFDARTHTVPNEHGRVLDESGRPIPGTYVVGWIKRGAKGGIGANRQDAAETVTALIDDIVAGRLPRATRSARSLRARLSRGPVRA